MSTFEHTSRRTRERVRPASEELLAQVLWTTEDAALAAFLLAKAHPPILIARLREPLFGYSSIPVGVSAWERGELAGREAYEEALRALQDRIKRGRQALVEAIAW